jgi:hypothetical protein
MRTTLNIADDVLGAARERARREGRTAGEVISDLARCGLSAPESRSGVSEFDVVYGLRPIPRRGGLVTNEIVDRLRGDDA